MPAGHTTVRTKESWAGVEQPGASISHAAEKGAGGVAKQHRPRVYPIDLVPSFFWQLAGISNALFSAAFSEARFL